MALNDLRHSAFNSELNLDTFLFLWFWISLLGLIALDIQSDLGQPFQMDLKERVDLDSKFNYKLKLL